jgi:hypothetical protein
MGKNRESLKLPQLIQAVGLAMLLPWSAYAGSQNLPLSKEDESFLVRQTIEYELNGQGASQPNKPLYLSKGRIGSNLLVGLASDMLIILTPDEIKKRISGEEEFSYLKFVKIRAKANRASVILVENKYKRGNLVDYEVVTHHYRMRKGSWIRTGRKGYLAPRI